jgi:hypothetical protein
MDLVLQIFAGGCYLLNKILFAFAEERDKKLRRMFKIIGWAVYIVGVPAWVIILVGKQNWIAASIEAGGLPAMFLGLYTVFQDSRTSPKRLEIFASFFTYASLALGFGYSLFDYGGITQINQVLEIGVMFGFLFGSLLLAKGNRRGWLFFMLMNGSMGTLMLIQGKPFLAVQQLVSLSFVVYGYTASRRKIDN